MLLVISVYLVLAMLIGFLGRDRKFGFWGNFFCSVMLTPLIGILVLIAQYPTRYKTKRVYECPSECCS